MNEITITNKKFGSVRVKFINKVIWFVATDVAKCLGWYLTPNYILKKYVDDVEKRKIKCNTNSGIQKVIAVNISGLHKMVLHSKNKNAKSVEKWLVNEIITIENGDVEGEKAMTNLQIIDQREVLGKKFRIYGTIENPLFLAKDVAEWIEYDVSNVSKMVKNVDEDEKIITRTNNTSAIFLTEDGLYEVLMQSRKPIAKQFKKQVKQILKDIRKHGAYLTDNKVEEILSDPDTIIKLALQIKEERSKREEAEKIIEENKPKVMFADTVASTNKLLLVREVAKLASDEGIKIGEKRLWNKLREWGLICKNGTEPKQYGIDNGWFKVVEGTRSNAKGTFIYNTTKVTGKGQIYIISRLRAENGPAMFVVGDVFMQG